MNGKIDEEYVGELLTKFFIKIIKNSNEKYFDNIASINIKNIDDIFEQNTDVIKEKILDEIMKQLDNSVCSEVLNVIPLGEAIDKIFLKIGTNLNNYWANKAKKFFNEPGYKYVMKFPMKDRETAYLDLIRAKNFDYKLDTNKYNYNLYDEDDKNDSSLYGSDLNNSNYVEGEVEDFTDYASSNKLLKDLYLNKNDMDKIRVVLSKYISEDEICRKKIIENKNLLERIEILIENYIHHNLNRDSKIKLVDKVLNIIGDMPNCSVLVNDILDKKTSKSVIESPKKGKSSVVESPVVNLTERTAPMVKTDIIDNSNLDSKNCSCRGPGYKYNSTNNTCWNKTTGDSIDVCVPYERRKVNIKSNKEYNPKEELLYNIQEIKKKYWLLNEECSNMMKDNTYITRFIKGYSVYLIEGFQKLLGYVPKGKYENNLSLIELKALHSLLKNLPKCNHIVNLYIDEQPLNNKSINNNYKSLFEPIYDKLNKMNAKLSEIEDDTDNLKYLNLENNKKKINKENFYEDYSGNETREPFEHIGHEQQIDYFQSSDSNNFDLMSHNNTENIRSGQQYSDGSYTPQYEFDHSEPSKTIASAYGWSYIPPQFWSVPQKRPPVCIPSKNTESKVCPSIEKGVPIGALDMTEVGSILPKFEYKEIYNPDYYYPGWITQDKINYPNKNGNFSNKYYNYNKANKI